MRPIFANSAIVTVPERLVLKGGSWRTVDLGVRYAVWVHPALGPVLIDTGYGPEVIRGRRSLPLRIYAAVIRPKLAEQPEAVLERLGFSANDVTTIIITHFHADHISGLQRFPQARFIASGVGWAALSALSGFQQIRHGVFTELLPDDFNFRLIKLEDLSETDLPFGLGRGHDILGDGSLISVDLPGHALGHTGVLWPDLNLMYAADTTWLKQAVDEQRPPRGPARWVYEDEDAMEASLGTIRQAQTAGCEVVMCHDPAA